MTKSRAHHDVTFALVQAVVGQLLVGAAPVEDAGAGQVHEVVHCDHEEDVSIPVTRRSDLLLS